MKTMMMMAGLALCALSAAALAGPQKMTADQMAEVTAGTPEVNGFLPAFFLSVLTTETNSQTHSAAQTGEAAAVNLHGAGATAGLTQTITQSNAN
jgi:hypothetical protein